MSDPLLAVEEVHAGYGLTEVLQGVSFDVDHGSVVALVGRNGVGKTTTLRTIVGNLAPTSGRIIFNGEDVSGLATEKTVRQGITFVPEDRRVFPGLTVRENIEMGQHGVSSEDGPSVDAVLDRFENLREREGNYGSVLSGGEQQMLAIARALIADPDLLLLDEPTEGLAPFVVREIEDIIQELNDDGITVLLVEQNIPVALDVADHAYILAQGEIVHSGPAAAVRDDEDLLDRHLGVGAID